MHGDKEILAIIPARGGSKSVPRKNIKLLGGKPLIAYAIQEAAKSKYINRCIVSTEDQEIADISLKFGAEVPTLRPRELAEDHVKDLPVFQHLLSWLADNENYRPDFVVHLRPTAPLRTVEHIDKGIEILMSSPDTDAVRSVCPAAQHPLKMWRVDDGKLVSYVPSSVYGIEEAYNHPRQKLPPAYIQNGSVDVIRTSVILEQNSMSGKNIKALVMEESESVNIDSPMDWAMAEILIKHRK
ncbi:acylneuraminate cytidylyltransferase family protein [bacterium]|nr:acylneuraminate cytidylyltransferase family protein [bacterium]